MPISLEPDHDPYLTIGPGGGLWRIDGERFWPLMEVMSEKDHSDLDTGVVSKFFRSVTNTPSTNHRVEKLVSYLEVVPSFLGEPLLVVGRRVPYGPDGADTIDLLALDENAVIHVIAVEPELATARTVERIAGQGGWVHQSIGPNEVRDIFNSYRTDISLDQAFVDHFERAWPDEITGQKNVIVARDVDGVVEDLFDTNKNADRSFRAVTFAEYKDAGSIRILVRRSILGRELELYVRRDDR